MDSQDVLEFVFSNSIIDASVNKMVGVVVMVSLALATILYLLTLAQNYIKSSIGSLKDQSSSSFVDYEDLARTLVILGAIVLYMPLINATTETIEFLNKFTAPGKEEYQVMEIYAENYTAGKGTYAHEMSEEVIRATLDGLDANSQEDAALKMYLEDRLAQMNTNEDGSTENPTEAGAEDSGMGILKVLTRISDIINNPGQIIDLVIYAAAYSILKLLKLIIYSIATNVLKVLIVIGPLAFAFSILPAFKNQLSIWAGTYLNVAFVFTTLNIIDALLITSMKMFASEGPTQADVGGSTTLMFALTQIILYLSAFWLTSKFIGKADGGMALTKIVAMAAAATGIAMAGGAAVGAGAAAGQTNVATAAGTATDIVKNE